MAGLFVFSRVIARVSGVQFDTSALYASWQHLDPQLLEQRLLESLYYLHTQPPFFNFVLGCGLKLAGAGSAVFFQALLLVMGAGLYAILFALMRRLGVSRTCALIASTVFVLSPSFILYESWLFYTLPLAFLVGSAAWCFAWLLERKSGAACLSFFAVVAVLCATHGIFHLLYLLGCVALVLVARALPPRVVLAAAIVPLILVGAIYTKNAIVFGQFNTSTWMGMNLALRRVEALPASEKERLIAAGALSEIARVTPFDPLDHYPSRYVLVPSRFADVPALASPRKSDGSPNLNHVAYIEISKRYAEDTKFVLRHYPKILLLSLLRGWHEYFRSSSDYWFVQPNIERSPLMRAENRLFDVVLYGVFVKESVGFFLVVSIPLLAVATLRAAYRGALSGARSLTREQRLLLVFCVGTISFVAIVANTLNALENMRIRFMTDPLIVILAAFWIDRWLLPRIRERRARGADARPRIAEAP